METRILSGYTSVEEAKRVGVVGNRPGPRAAEKSTSYYNALNSDNIYIFTLIKFILSDQFIRHS